MSSSRTLLCLLALTMWLWHPATPVAQTSTGIAVYEGARLITGDGSAPIEDSAFVVEGGRFTQVGRRGALQVPAGAARVDLTGKTVIPALVDGHSHIGYQKGPSTSVKNYTRENILDHMHRFAYYGIAASLAMGSDFGEMPYQVRRDILAGQFPDAARFVTAGRGLSPMSEISSDNMRHAAYVVTTEEGAREDVRELASHGVGIVKTWVRGNPRMPASLYVPIIDEAHRNNVRVAVHATDPVDVKPLLRAGMDIFAHMIEDVDDEMVALFKQHPNAVVLSALSVVRLPIYAPWLDPVDPLLASTQSPAHIKLFRDRQAAVTAQQRTSATAAWEKQARGIKKLYDAGVKIGLGTDGGGQNGGYIGWTAHMDLENLVAAGLTPIQVIEIATKNTAEILRIDELGMVAPLKSADFVVLDANPLDDIKNTRKISRVYLRGHMVDRAKLQARWKAEGSATN